MKIIDSHIHFWDISNGYNNWVKDTSLPNKVTPLTIGENIRNYVHIEAHSEDLSPLCEYQWLKRFNDYNIKTIAFIDFNQNIETFKKIVRRLSEYTNIVGVRHIMAQNNESTYSPYKKTIAKDLGDKLCILKKNNMVFECQMYPNQILDHLEVIVDSQVKVVVEHFGLPIYRNNSNMLQWKKLLEAINQYENLYLKLSGLDLNNHVSDFNELIDITLLKVKSMKLCYGSNYPVTNNTDYKLWGDLLFSRISEKEDLENIFHDGKKIYRF